MPKPTVFISYQRKTGKNLARTFYDRLCEWRIDTFFDVKNLGSGEFSLELEKQIINRDLFLLILTPETLQSEWVRKEVEIALRHRKQIIPIVEAGFDFYAHIPAEVQGLQQYNAIEYDYRHPEIAEAKLRRALGIGAGWRAPLIAGSFIVIAVIAALLMVNTFASGDTASTTPEVIAATAIPITSTGGFPCEGTIVFTTGALLNVVRALPSTTAPSRPPVQQGAIVTVTASQVELGDLWYRIEYEQDAGWISERYIYLAGDC